MDTFDKAILSTLLGASKLGFGFAVATAFFDAMPACVVSLIAGVLLLGAFLHERKRLDERPRA
jgi:hypothetical protein